MPLVEASLRLALVKTLLERPGDDAGDIDTVAELTEKSDAVLETVPDMIVEPWLEPIFVATSECVVDKIVGAVLTTVEVRPNNTPLETGFASGETKPGALDCVVLMIKFDEMLEGVPPEAFPSTSVDAERKDATLDAVGEEVWDVGLERPFPGEVSRALLAVMSLETPVGVEISWLVLAIATSGVALVGRP